MSLGLIGRKVGMTRVFTVEGDSIPVTVLEVIPNRARKGDVNKPDRVVAPINVKGLICICTDLAFGPDSIIMSI